jgi:hypothetical protein
MAVKLGSTTITDIYLGEAIYGQPQVVKIYLGSTVVWQVA